MNSENAKSTSVVVPLVAATVAVAAFAACEVTKENPWGFTGGKIEVEPIAVAQWMAAYKYDTAKDGKFAISFPQWLAQKVNGKLAHDAEKYVTNQAYQRAEKAIMAIAARTNTTPAEVAKQAGIELRIK